jgi:sulfur-oxidizing protein SoxX
MVEKSRISAAPGSRNLSPVVLVLACVFIIVGGISGAFGDDTPARGKALAMEKSKGNCLACHIIADGKQPGNIGPPLIAMKARFPDSEILFKQIWDATQNNPETRMPPFGRHGILSREEIVLIIEYLYTL